jgi:hypothetical protein
MKSIKIGDICSENRVVTVPVSTKTKTLVDIFNRNNIQSIVVLKEEQTAGLVMRISFFIVWAADLVITFICRKMWRQ